VASGAQETTPRTGEAAARPTPAPTGTTHADTHPARLHALVISDSLVATYPLPESGDVHIGRGSNCEIVVDDISISRSHAVLAIGPTLVLRDLGSANGTKIRGRALAPNEAVEIVAGEAIELGSATLIVQRRSAPLRPRRLWTHDYFEVRLEEECARAARRGTTFAVLRLTCTGEPTQMAAQEALADLVRLSDVVGEYGPRDFEILLVDTGPDEVELAIARIVRELERHGIAVRVGYACCPRDGRHADELMSRAGATARGVDVAESPRDHAVVVADRTMQELHGLAARIASGTIGVLILGETGAGKEVLAERIHRLSPRAGKPYLRLNCAALSETLLESELFGHERGAFTGAVGTKPGLLETADGGTVFLDEVGDLPLALQAKLLRVIEEHLVLRVGGLKPRPIDVRFIAATNRDLEAEVARGSFRQDLFFRLNGATLVIPPLRERLAEIPVLARMFLEQAAKLAGLSSRPSLSQEAVEVLVRYGWPGNIRELRNVIERAVLLCGPGTIQPRHLPLEKLTSYTPAVAPPPLPTAQPSTAVTQPLPPPARAATSPMILRRGARLSTDEERRQIEAALAACGGNQTRAAAMLGIARRTLVNRLREFGLTRKAQK
jgi:DNA-binding NtrC family response regulator/pSer/pThr/pTyr-binding forkhead associated (FHA) protein